MLNCGTDCGVQQAEDRELFRTLMNDLDVPVPESDIVNTVEQAFSFKEQVGYPLIVRPAFTMGGYRRRHLSQ